MLHPKPQPVDSIDNLRKRVDRLLKAPARRKTKRAQRSLDLPFGVCPEVVVEHPSRSIADFLDFIVDAVPDGDLYLFGGVLRDLALLGRRGFNSDIDLVVEGNWQGCTTYLESLGARKNKFGGYRLQVAGWPVDIWSAKKTWAIEQGLVPYKGIASLTETTVLNWDAILMNWRTHSFILRKNYLESIRSRELDIVLEKNPNPLGMVVRVLRHFCSKDARKITPSAAQYLANSTKKYTFDEIKNSEIRSYGSSLIEPPIYRLFEHFNAHKGLDIGSRFSIACDMLQREVELPLVT